MSDVEKVARAIAGAYARRAWPHKPDVIDNWVNKSFRTFFDEARAALAAAEAGEPATGKGGLQVEEIRQAILDHCWGDSNGNVNGSILAAEAIATAIRARGETQKTRRPG